MTAGYDTVKRPTSFSFGAAGSVTQSYLRSGWVDWEERSFSGITGDAGTGRQDFTYDAVGRLVGSSGLATGDRTYTYDRDGNRTSKLEQVGGQQRTFFANYDRTGAITSIMRSDQPGPYQATYDPFGNLILDPQTGLGTTAFAYDAADRLTSIDPAGTANDTTFAFDALGRHTGRTISGATEAYEFVGLTETVTKVSGTTPITSLVGPSGERMAAAAGSTVRWMLGDAHGNVVGQASGTSLAAALRYDGWGQTIATWPTTLPSDAERWKYQGRLDIAPSGLDQPLYEFSARFYAPGSGVFTQLDSVQGSPLDPRSLNRYLYALANPTSLIDPTGHDACIGRDCDEATYDNGTEGIDRCVSNCQQSSTERGPGDPGYEEDLAKLGKTVKDQIQSRESRKRHRTNEPEQRAGGSTAPPRTTQLTIAGVSVNSLGLPRHR